MAIVASDISLSARHEAVQTHSVQQSMRIQVGGRTASSESRGDQVSISKEALAALQEQDGEGLESALSEMLDDLGGNGRGLALGKELGRRPNAGAKEAEGAEGKKEKGSLASMDLKTQLFAMLFEKLTGRKFEMLDPEDLKGSGEEQVAPQASGQPVQAEGEAQPTGEGFGFAFDYSETHYESETLEFQAGGTIKTSDGQEIEFSVNVKMSREFYSSNEIHIRAGTLKDPLMLNFDGLASQLGDTNFRFDIDGDGNVEQLAAPQAGTGLVGIDKNGNGKIDDGSELLGTKTGNAFGELAAYDSDGSGFIDEGDAVFDQLKVLKAGADGENQTLDLHAAGVAGIGLGHVATPFEMRNSQNQAQAFVRATGVFLKTSGQVGTAQQIDFNV